MKGKIKGARVSRGKRRGDLVVIFSKRELRAAKKLSNFELGNATALIAATEYPCTRISEYDLEG